MKCKLCNREFHSPPGFPIALCSACIVGGTDEDTRPARSDGRPQSTQQPPSDGFEELQELQQLFPEFDFDGKLGAGGMGMVVKARQKNLDRWVAVKLLSPKLKGDPEFEERFEREARAMAMLNHPNIVGIHDYGIRGHFHYLVMEYVDGRDLHQLIRAGKIDPELAFSIIRQICAALHYAHKNGVVHRDVKPGNILVDSEGVAKIGDFGLARIAQQDLEVSLTMTNAGMGTPSYMAPEQLTDAKSIDSRADIFALGVVVYEMLTGHVPAGNFPPPTSSYPRRNKRLDSAVLRAMEPDPEKRISDVRDIARSLRAGSRDKSSRKLAEDSPPPVGVETARWLIPTLVVLALGGIVVAGLSWWQSDYRSADDREGNTSGASISGHDSASIAEPDPTRSIPPVRAAVSDDFEKLRSIGGRLRTWSEKPGTIDISAADGVDDLIAVENLHMVGNSWFAARANGEMISSLPTLHQRRDYWKMQNAFSIQYPDRLVPVDRSHPKFLELLSPAERAVDVAQNDYVAVIITPDGRVVLAATERWKTAHQFVIDRLAGVSDAVSADAYSKMFVVLRSNGETVAWHEDHGLIETPESDSRLVQVEAGGSHLLGLYDDGSIVTWTVPRFLDLDHERLNAALADPVEHGPAIRIEAIDFVNTAQRPDGTWFAWGDDGERGLIDQVNAMGRALDLEMFLINNMNGAKLVWIEPTVP